MYMQQLLSQIAPTASPSGIGTKSLVGQGSTGDQDFGNILQGILGAVKKTGETQTKSSVTLQTLGNIQKSSQDDLTLLNSILQKLSTALNGKTDDIDSAQLNDLLKNSLTDEELSFIQQFIQTTGQGATAGNEQTGNSLNSILQGSETGAADTKQTVISLMAGLLTAVNKMIENTGTITGQGSVQQNTASLSAAGRTADQDQLQMLTALRDSLQQLCNKCASITQNAAGQEQTVLQGSENTVQTGRQTTGTGQNNAAGNGQTAQTPVQSDVDLQKSIEQLLLNNQGMQKLAASINAQKEQKPMASANQFLGQMPDSVTKNVSPLTQNNTSLANQALNITDYLLPFQTDGKQAAEQFLNRLQALSNLSSQSETTLLTVQSGQEGIITPAASKGNASDRESGQTLLFKDALLNQNIQQTTTRTDNLQTADKAEARVPLNSAYIVEELANKINSGLKYGEQKLSMQLYPPSLGKLNIELSMKDNQLRAVIVAESQQVKQLLEGNIDQLRTCLQNQNIQVEKCSVLVGYEGGQQQQFDQQTAYLRDRNARERKNEFYNSGVAALDDELLTAQSLTLNARSFIGADTVDVFA